jgi:hypothetical protein
MINLKKHTLSAHLLRKTLGLLPLVSDLQGCSSYLRTYSATIKTVKGYILALLDCNSPKVDPERKVTSSLRNNIRK